MYWKRAAGPHRVFLVAGMLAIGPLAIGQAPGDTPPEPVLELIRSSSDPAVASFLQEIYEVNPELERARAGARGAAELAPQVGDLPDPTLALAAYLLPPETRTGPQRLSATLAQRFPSRGKRRLREVAADAHAAAERALAEETALDRVSQARRILVRLAYLGQAQAVVEQDLETLTEFEELSRARYSAGRGMAQAVIKLQAEITRAQTRLLALADQRAGDVARLNALRNRPRSDQTPTTVLPEPRPELPRLEDLRERALARSPGAERMRHLSSLAQTRVGLARTQYRPDLSLGLTYTLVQGRQDEPGRALPPPDNGDDILGLAATINLPIRKKRLEAGVRQALEGRNQAEHALAGIVLELDREIGQVLARYPLVYEQWKLLGHVLLPQAREALASARYGYETARIDLLDLLDAERVLLEVRLGILRAATDLQLLVVDLEQTIAGPLPADAADEVSHDQHN